MIFQTLSYNSRSVSIPVLAILQRTRSKKGKLPNKSAMIAYQELPVRLEDHARSVAQNLHAWRFRVLCVLFETTKLI